VKAGQPDITLHSAGTFVKKFQIFFQYIAKEGNKPGKAYERKSRLKAVGSNWGVRLNERGVLVSVSWG